MPDNADLMAHPRTFLRTNILIVTAAGGGVGGVKNFTLARSNSYTGKNMLVNGNPAMDVFSLRMDGGGGAGAVQAQWCPYTDSAYLGTTLPGAGGPDLMFTFAMDGCTFVAGSVTPTNDVSVHHVNMKGETGLGPLAQEQQFRLQRNVARSLVTGAQLIDPDDYYDPNTRAAPIPENAKISTVTFGRRSSNGSWKFYTHQYYSVPGNRMELCFIGSQRAI